MEKVVLVVVEAVTVILSPDKKPGCSVGRCNRQAVLLRCIFLGLSTETNLLKVVNDLFLFPNKGNISVLALLDFSSAFHTIDHPILVHRLHSDFGFIDAVLQWF